jgi:hypothetical protein
MFGATSEQANRPSIGASESSGLRKMVLMSEYERTPTGVNG